MNAKTNDTLNLIGKQLGQYEILEEIGRGGMAVVYKAYQPSLNRYVAIKVLLPHLSLDKEFIERFQREALAAGKLEHPNIIHIYDVGQEGDLHYLVMSLVAGPNLAARLAREGALDSRTAFTIVRQVGAALDFAHSQGVVHRDVKPSNILLTSTGEAILTDFGIAMAASESRLTQTGAHIGTPAYMSPEQAEGHTVDGRADLYSLGVVLYEMLSGQVPFQADTPAAVLYKQVHTPPPSLSTLRPTVPKAVEHVVLRALEKDPNKRYPHASEMVDALAQAMLPETVRATQLPVRNWTRYRSLLLAVGVLVLAVVIVPRLLKSEKVEATPTPKPVVVVTASATKTLKPTVTRTATPLPPTAAPSRTPTYTPTIKPVPPTATVRPAPTRTPRPTPSPTPVVITIDDLDSGFSTSGPQDPWQEYRYDKTDGQNWGPTHQFNSLVGTGQDTATWTFTVPQPGRYEVYAWWWAADRRPDHVPYTIYHAGGTSTEWGNQQQHGKQWNLLGTFDFDGAGKVVVSDNVSSGEHIVADAIRLVFVTSSPSTLTGTLIKGPGRPVYLLEGGTLHWFPNDSTFFDKGYNWDQIPPSVPLDVLRDYPVGDPVLPIVGQLRDGELVMGTGETKYVIQAGQKRRITDWSASQKAHDFKDEDVALVTDSWLGTIEDGDDLSD
jgi:serine/threonine protein kinase